MSRSLVNRRVVAGLSLTVFGTVLVGCVQSKGCFCEGEELDFSVVGELAGEWGLEGGGVVMRFDRQQRLRHYIDQYYGCGPGYWPLVPGAETARKAGFDYATKRLVSGSTEPGAFELHHVRDETSHQRLRVELVGERLLLYFSSGASSDVPPPEDVDSELIRFSEDPAPTPEEPDCD